MRLKTGNAIVVALQGAVNTVKSSFKPLQCFINVLNASAKLN